MAESVSSLRKEGALVRVVMTRAAESFISPLTFEALSGEKVLTEEDFLRGWPDPIPHISNARWAEAIIIAPATAATIARLAQGEADSLLVATVMASQAPVLVCPAMNASMFNHPATQRNLQMLESYGYRVLKPEEGPLACGEEGQGRLPDWPTIREEVLSIFSPQDLKGKKILISAGPTREPLDPVRFISNRSSGKMGYALARAARRRGAEVVLVSGPVSLAPPPGVKVIFVETAEEMAREMLSRASWAEVIIMAAAVADYRPLKISKSKIKKERQEMEIRLSKTKDILAELGKNKRPGQIVIGFAAETENLLPRASQKLKQKAIDIIVANRVGQPGIGFESDTNQVTILSPKKPPSEIRLAPKEEIADKIYDYLIEFLKMS